MPTAHLLFGLVGSGKTTLARDLEQRHRAVRFTPDEWMARLFGENPPADTFPQHAAVILDLMEPVWTRCLTLGIDVVLDYGFWRRTERDQARRVVESCGARALLYKVECPEDEARRRVAARNGHADRSLFIAPETFDVLRERLEPLHADEVFIAAVPKPT
ncbi:AAA family ATPase [Methylobacterium sp. SyP6R]|uniref:AAA family ATPase n=1 Tax=Methylobacterium sp. SyP6R TaxID=2718876 RepID=UPI001F199783|nr:AAA family ATPase [Methylobacterium sp. SyP6R]MCF4129302.1 AAA family ATPase [Methylobacterium sp. SyP6R]